MHLIDSIQSSSCHDKKTANYPLKKGMRLCTMRLRNRSLSRPLARPCYVRNLASVPGQNEPGGLKNGHAAYFKSIVKVFTWSTAPSLVMPWQNKLQRENTGSGFVIDGRRILTNAHVVAHHTFVEVIDVHCVVSTFFSTS